jgi:hypothetical protein
MARGEGGAGTVAHKSPRCTRHMTGRSSLHHLNERLFHVTSSIQQQLTLDIDALVHSTAARLFLIWEQVSDVVVCQHSMPEHLRMLQQHPLPGTWVLTWNQWTAFMLRGLRNNIVRLVRQAAWVR